MKPSHKHTILEEKDMAKKLNPVSMKKENKRIILRYLMEKGKASRAELSKETGLAQSAVWRLIGELEDNGLLEVVGISTHIGRSSVIYGPTKSFVTSIIFNVEIAETLVGVGYLDGSWEIVDSFDTQKDFEKFRNMVINSFEKITKEYPTRNHISKVVFSLPGIVNYENKTLICAPNLNWRNIDFGKEFMELGIEIFIENDANLSMLAERFFSPDVKNSKVAFFLYFGEGIGGALLVNGNIVRGRNSAAGEIGHVSFCEEELERYLSLMRLLETSENAIDKSGAKNNTLQEKFHYLKSLWSEGNEETKKALESYIKHLAITLRNIIYFINPDVIILGGLINDMHETFGNLIEEELYRVLDKTLFNTVIRDTIFEDVPPSLVGANVLVLEHFLRIL